MSATPQTINADDAKVGFTVITTKATFDRLLRLAATPDMEGWSPVVAKLIDKAGRP